MSVHKHKAIMSEREIRPWTHCVLHHWHNDDSHGGVMLIDHCRCGAVRYSEENGRYITYGEWIEKEEAEKHE